MPRSANPLSLTPILPSSATLQDDGPRSAKGGKGPNIALPGRLLFGWQLDGDFRVEHEARITATGHRPEHYRRRARHPSGEQLFAGVGDLYLPVEIHHALVQAHKELAHVLVRCN